MHRFVTATALVAALALGGVATPSLADGMQIVVSTPQSPCGLIFVEGNNNTVNCTVEAAPADNDFREPQSRPQRQRSAQACVTRYGNFPLVVRMPINVVCWQPLGGGMVQGWTGTFYDDYADFAYAY